MLFIKSSDSWKLILSNSYSIKLNILSLLHLSQSDQSIVCHSIFHLPGTFVYLKVWMWVTSRVCHTAQPDLLWTWHCSLWSVNVLCVQCTRESFACAPTLWRWTLARLTSWSVNCLKETGWSDRSPTRTIWDCGQPCWIVQAARSASQSFQWNFTLVPSCFESLLCKLIKSDTYCIYSSWITRRIYCTRGW